MSGEELEYRRKLRLEIRVFGGESCCLALLRISVQQHSACNAAARGTGVPLASGTSHVLFQVFFTSCRGLVSQSGPILIRGGSKNTLSKALMHSVA